LGRGADDDDEEITGTGEENIKVIDEEEEEENPLPGTQEPEQVLVEDSKAGQQSHQQSEEEEQSGEDEVEDTEEEAEDTAMAKDCDMTPRLQFWYGNSKDRTSIEWWCDAVDRIKDQKGWNNDQGKKSAASVAVDTLREDSSLLISIIAKGHQAAAVKDWSLMKPLLIKRYSTIKTCTQRAKQFATLTQKSDQWRTSTTGPRWP
jgi:hypothetical protein